MPRTARSEARGRVRPLNLRDAQAVADLFVGFFRRDLHGFFPQSRFEPRDPGPSLAGIKAGPRFTLVEGGTIDGPPPGGDTVEMFRAPYTAAPPPPGPPPPHHPPLIPP